MWKRGISEEGIERIAQSGVQRNENLSDTLEPVLPQDSTLLSPQEAEIINSVPHFHGIVRAYTEWVDDWTDRELAMEVLQALRSGADIEEIGNMITQLQRAEGDQ